MPASLTAALQLLYAGRFFSFIASAISKSSFAFTLMPLVRERWQRSVLWSILISLNLVLWICGFSLFFQCSPIRKAWDVKITGTCWTANVQGNVGAVAGSKPCPCHHVAAGMIGNTERLNSSILGNHGFCIHPFGRHFGSASAHEHDRQGRLPCGHRSWHLVSGQ